MPPPSNDATPEDSVARNNAVANPTRVTVVLVTYQSNETIGPALGSLRPHFDAGLLRAIVVDNASSDGTVARVTREHPWATVVESGGNVGYGRGCNIGLARATTEYVMFMNPDATLSHDAIPTLVSFLDSHPRAAMAAPAIVEGDHLQSAGPLPTPLSIITRAAGSRSHSLRQRPIVPGAPAFATEWLCGAILMARTKLVRELRGFDTNIFLYFEETDLCRRMRDQGWELWAVGQAEAAHAASASARGGGEDLISGCIAEHYYRSRYYYMAKSHGRLAAIAAELGELLVLAARCPLNWARGRRGELVRRLRYPVMKNPVFPQSAES
jgi:N-acetylglucosaminyl-diphospho-decaprenol L-rhamnosyltransferase